MEIHQVLATASPGDAIMNSALAQRELLRRIGPSNLYAQNIHPDVADDVQPLARYARRLTSKPDRDVIIYHASIGEPRVFGFLMERRERLVVQYHNISPAEPYLTYDPAFAGLLEAGRRELQDLAERTTLALVPSAFNAKDLESLGYSDVRVAPLLVDATQLLRIAPDPDTTQHLQEVIKGPVVLFVGQLLPHKRPDALIKAFHALTTYMCPDFHLIIVGAARLPRYYQLLRMFTEELNLATVWFTGAVSDAELAAFYRRADVFLTLSEHEGFCVPLLESMAFGIPVVGRDGSAIPETMGGAGILLPSKDDSTLAAEVIAEVVSRPEVSRELIARGTRRLADFEPDRSRAVLLEHLIGAL